MEGKMTLQLSWNINHQAQNYHFSEASAVTIGRKRDCDIVLGDRSVSRRHAELFVEKEAMRLQNLSQTNVIYVYTRRKLTVGETATLKAGDTLHLGMKKMRVQIASGLANTPTLQLTTAEATYSLGNNESVIIGRQADCDIVLYNRTVSRHHAEICLEEGRFSIRNLSQASPLYIYSRQRLGYGQMAQLNVGDTFTIGSTRIRTQPIQALIDEQRTELAHLYKIPCHGCGRKINANHQDCPWCGVSLTCETKATW
jgi:predicted component of type VI protein secretion system